MAEAVNLIEQGKAPVIVQSEEGATYDPMLNKPELCKLNLAALTASQAHNFIRGCDKVPGAWVSIEGHPVKLYGSTLWRKGLPDKDAQKIKIDGN